MNQPRSHTVTLSGDYPIFKVEGDKLVPLSSFDPKRRYALTTSAETGETYFRQFSDEEEALADKQKAEWEAGEAGRKAEAKRQADLAAQFEQSLRYENRIVAFLDILGWKEAVLNPNRREGDPVVALGKALSHMQVLTSFYNSLGNLMPNSQKWPGNPVLTQFSDSLVISVEDNPAGKDALQNALSALTSTLIGFGLLLRGGVTRGDLFHDGSLVFGPGLIEAYELESTVASSPRVILSKELSSEWGNHEATGALPWVPSPDGYLFFNFLPPFMGNLFFTDAPLWQSSLNPVRDLILQKANDPSCSEGVFSKYLWLASYFDKVCDSRPTCGVEKVLQEAIHSRWRAKAVLLPSDATPWRPSPQSTELDPAV